jgi:hypothetical protein
LSELIVALINKTEGQRRWEGRKKQKKAGTEKRSSAAKAERRGA